MNDGTDNNDLDATGDMPVQDSNGSEPGSHSPSKRKIATIGTIITILVVTGLVITWFMLIKPMLDRQPQERVATAIDRAGEAAQKGDTVEVEKQYRQLIDEQTDTSNKTLLLVDWAKELYANGKTEEALKVAEEAEKNEKDKFLVADWLALVYEEQKNYMKAAEYYALAGEWADSPMNNYSLGKQYFDDEAARVRALEKK